MWHYKIAMATFHTSHCQDGEEVLKCGEWRCQGTKRRFRKPEHAREHQEGLTGILLKKSEKFWTLQAKFKV